MHAQWKSQGKLGFVSCRIESILLGYVQFVLRLPYGIQILLGRHVGQFLLSLISRSNPKGIMLETRYWKNGFFQYSCLWFVLLPWELWRSPAQAHHMYKNRTPYIQSLTARNAERRLSWTNSSHAPWGHCRSWCCWEGSSNTWWKNWCWQWQGSDIRDKVHWFWGGLHLKHIRTSSYGCFWPLLVLGPSLYNQVSCSLAAYHQRQDRLHE